MDTYKKITVARKLLELPEHATRAEIKNNYKQLLKKWHPDICTDKTRRCVEMTSKINTAYKIIIGYCNQYQFSFAKNEVKKYLPQEEWWLDRFGQDPVWNQDTDQS